MSLGASQLSSTEIELERLRAELSTARSQLSAVESERDQLAKLLKLRMLELERLRRQIFAR
jgi:predicted  nucleic acid-binding Zn-ribbon protein